MKDLDYVPTPRSTGEIILDFADLPQGSTVLDPHAGEGHLAGLLQEYGYQPLCGELNARRVALLRSGGYKTWGGDFLMSEAQNFGRFDHIIMSPPFKSGAYMEHVYHAFDLLPQDGVLVSVVPQSMLESSTKDLDIFRVWLYRVEALMRRLPSGSFPQSKTNVETLLIKVRKS